MSRARATRALAAASGMVVVAVAASFIAGCGSNGRDVVASPPTVQVERIGRPAVNEGLIITNDLLNAFNSIPPSQDLNPNNNATITAVQNEAIATLNAVDPLAGGDNVNPNDVVTAFLPDVLRIDVTVASPVGTGAYANSAVAVGTVVRPVAGRKLEDDVIDITLTVLIGAAVADNVSMQGTAGNQANLPQNAGGHQFLNGQTAFGGTATFPFLPPAN